MLYDVQITSLSSTDVRMFNYLRKLNLVEKNESFKNGLLKFHMDDS